jgi:hypothetical protein
MYFYASTISPSSTGVSKSRRRSGECLFGLSETRSRSSVLSPVRAGSEPRQYGQLSESEPTNRSRALASHTGGLPGHGASALGWNYQPHPRAALAGTLHGRRGGAGCDKNAGATGCGKAAGWESHKPDFPTPLGNPAKCAGFPLSPSPDCCWLTMKPDISCAKKTGHFNLLRTVEWRSPVGATVRQPFSVLRESLKRMLGGQGRHMPSGV